MTGPDFIGIGAQRSGTSWLYEVLYRHPALWLPPIKELHYFDDPLRSKRYYRFLRMRLVAGLWIRRPLTTWDLRYFLGHPNDEWYCGLFERGRRRGLRTGEITPAYSILDEAGLGHIHAVNPQVKLIFLMRDPILRAWSALMKLNHDRGLSEFSTNDAIRYACTKGILARSNYYDSIERLERVFARDQIFYGFFEDICTNPGRLIANLLGFLDVDSKDDLRLPLGPVNAIAAGKLPPQEFERALADHLLPSVQRLCERFDGPPHIWQARYKALLNGSSISLDAC